MNKQTLLAQPAVPDTPWIQQRFRWQRDRSAPSDRWQVRIEVKPLGQIEWHFSPNALLQFLAVGGRLLVGASKAYVEWLVPGCDAAFRALRVELGWIFESREWGGSRWYECDERCIEIALGVGVGASAVVRVGLDSTAPERLPVSPEPALAPPMEAGSTPVLHEWPCAA